jgi:ubiquitin carboxyl-terminal hydrolase 7
LLGLCRSGPLIVVVIEDEAFAAKHMPDLGHDVKDFKVFTWKLTNWKKLEKKLTSQEFECGGHRWSIPFTAFHDVMH